MGKLLFLEGHSISRPSIPKIVDFLLSLRKEKRLSCLAIAEYRSMLSAMFKFTLPKISSSLVLKDLLLSFYLKCPMIPIRAPPWDLQVVLGFLRSSSFEPVSSLSKGIDEKDMFSFGSGHCKVLGSYEHLQVFLFW